MDRDGIWFRLGGQNYFRNDGAYNTAWKVEVTIDVLVHINNEGCQERMHRYWKEDCYSARQKLL
jgi:hypothetical protein